MKKLILLLISALLLLSACKNLPINNEEKPDDEIIDDEIIAESKIKLDFNKIMPEEDMVILTESYDELGLHEYNARLYELLCDYIKIRTRSVENANKGITDNELLNSYEVDFGLINIRMYDDENMRIKELNNIFRTQSSDPVKNLEFFYQTVFFENDTQTLYISEEITYNYTDENGKTAEAKLNYIHIISLGLDPELFLNFIIDSEIYESDTFETYSRNDETYSTDNHIEIENNEFLDSEIREINAKIFETLSTYIKIRSNSVINAFNKTKTNDMLADEKNFEMIDNEVFAAENYRTNGYYNFYMYRSIDTIHELKFHNTVKHIVTMTEGYLNVFVSENISFSWSAEGNEEIVNFGLNFIHKLTLKYNSEKEIYILEKSVVDESKILGLYLVDFDDEQGIQEWLDRPLETPADSDGE